MQREINGKLVLKIHNYSHLHLSGRAIFIYPFLVAHSQYTTSLSVVSPFFSILCLFYYYLSVYWGSRISLKKKLIERKERKKEEEKKKVGVGVKSAFLYKQKTVPPKKKEKEPPNLWYTFLSLIKLFFF